MHIATSQTDAESAVVGAHSVFSIRALESGWYLHENCHWTHIFPFGSVAALTEWWRTCLSDKAFILIKKEETCLCLFFPRRAVYCAVSGISFAFTSPFFCPVPQIIMAKMICLGLATYTFLAKWKVIILTVLLFSHYSKKYFTCCAFFKFYGDLLQTQIYTSQQSLLAPSSPTSDIC